MLLAQAPIPPSRRASPRLAALAASCALALLPLPTPGAATTQEDMLSQWISAQANTRAWTADAVQTRVFKTLAQPLVSTGKVWVAMPDRFRWELGQPPQTIALRQPEQLSIVYPRLKRIEKYPLKSGAAGPWQDALSLIEASFPKSRADVDARFRVQSVRFTNSVALLELAPRSASARKFVSGIEIGLRTNDFVVVSTTMRFSDGSSMRNDFSNIRINESLEATLFTLDEAAGYAVTEPAGR